MRYLDGFEFEIWASSLFRVGCSIIRSKGISSILSIHYNIIPHTGRLTLCPDKNHIQVTKIPSTDNNNRTISSNTYTTVVHRGLKKGCPSVLNTYSSKEITSGRLKIKYKYFIVSAIQNAAMLSSWYGGRRVTSRNAVLPNSVAVWCSIV